MAKYVILPYNAAQNFRRFFRELTGCEPHRRPKFCVGRLLLASAVVKWIYTTLFNRPSDTGLIRFRLFLVCVTSL